MAPDEVIYDHTTPWRCGDRWCVRCANKPSYDHYMRDRVWRTSAK
jgi:hypothetical protein